MDKKDFTSNLRELTSSFKKSEALLQLCINAAITYAFPKSEGSYEDYDATARLFNALYKGRQTHQLKMLVTYFKAHGPFNVTFSQDNKRWACSMDKGSDANPLIDPVVAFSDWKRASIERSWTVEGVTSSIEKIIKDINEHFSGEDKLLLLSTALSRINEALVPVAEAPVVTAAKEEAPVSDELPTGVAVTEEVATLAAVNH